MKGVEPYDDPTVAGFPVSLWVELFFQCNGLSQGLMFYGWPDGKPLTEQEQIVTECFDRMRGAVLDHINFEQQRKQRRK